MHQQSSSHKAAVAIYPHLTKAKSAEVPVVWGVTGKQSFVIWVILIGAVAIFLKHTEEGNLGHKAQNLPKTF